MACGIFISKSLSGPMLLYYQLDLLEHISVKLYSKFKSSNSNALESVVCEIGAILLIALIVISMQMIHCLFVQRMHAVVIKDITCVMVCYLFAPRY